MKLEINEKGKTKEREFPKLMICSSENIIVLFTENRKGTLLSKDFCHVFCGYRQDWIMGVFQDFEGSITLSND